MILQTDKNLGAAAMEWDVYVNSMLDEHLLNGDTYELLYPEEAFQKREDFREELIDLLTFDGDRALEDNERVYFSRSFLLDDRIPLLYGMPKVCKDYIRVHMQPVNSQCGSLSAAVSKYIDFYLQKLIKLVPSNVYRSQQFVNACQDIDLLLFDTKITSSDAKNMYGNIDPIEGIKTIEKYIELFAHEFKSHFPRKSSLNYYV